MDEHCKRCDQPRHPRKDRPGKFYSLCYEHYKEYMRQKNKESYDRDRERHVERKRRYRQENPEAVAATIKRYHAKPEVQERKRAYMETYRRPWREHVGLVCEECGFEATEKRQMDVHHKDEDRTNNDPSNLVTLCPPCHRLRHKPKSKENLKHSPPFAPKF